MKKQELIQALIAVLLLFTVFAFRYVIRGDSINLIFVFVFSFVVIAVYIFSRKGFAFLLDAEVKHKIWHVYRYGYKSKQHFKSPQPFGIIVPLSFLLFSFGFLKITTFLSYDVRALKYRAAKRFGFYSYKEITDKHNGLIGSSGIVALLILAILSEFFNFELLAKMAINYAFWNMLPISNLDGTQIFFGSRILWTILAIVIGSFTLYIFFI